jgi:hypothetical protein
MKNGLHSLASCSGETNAQEMTTLLANDKPAVISPA